MNNKYVFFRKNKLTVYWHGEYWIIILNVFPFWVRKEWIDGYDKERKSIVGELKRNWPEKMHGVTEQKGNILMLSWRNEWMNTWAVFKTMILEDSPSPDPPHTLAIAHRLFASSFFSQFLFVFISLFSSYVLVIKTSHYFFFLSEKIISDSYLLFH
jgi:hypothetical protein